MVIIEEEDYIAHYGILRRSGRYPWGSGNNQYQVNQSFLDIYASMKAQGISDVDFCRAHGIGITDSSGNFKPSTTQLRAAKTIAKNEQKQANIGMALRLKEKGLSNGAIAERMNLAGESSVRALTAPGAKDKADRLISISQMLKGEVDSKKYIDIGAGVENHIGVSKERLKTAVFMLKEQGYEVRLIPIPQVSIIGQDTQGKILCPPGTTQKEVWQNQNQIKQLSMVSKDGGESFGSINHSPIPVSSKRIGIVYADAGGIEADGMIYVRPGAKDLSLGLNRYAQVRIKVDDSHYLKGMAMYKEDLPQGVDLLFHTSKNDTGNKLDAMKPLTDDPNLPFGSIVDQITKDTGTPKEKNISAMNLVNEEGDWIKWNRNISAQALSKQSPALAKEQLNITYEARKADFDQIMELTNPSIKKKLLETFADSTDSSAVHLKAAALERQNWQVILPIESLSPHEVYAPNFRDGERVALIRYPHGGTFEIPELTVNNRHPQARDLIGPSAKDAIGIHSSVAQRLSGADFDGDTVLVIPNNNRQIKTSPALEKLKNFTPTSAYPAYEGMPKVKESTKQHQMGDISNLITDMTIQGASHEKIARAVRHSMVVIDSAKHNLNYKQSAIDNGIIDLKREYQGNASSGASTLISKAGSTINVLDRKPRPQSEGGPIDLATGKKMFVLTDKTITTRKGNVVPKTFPSKKLAETDDAHSLSSGTRIETVYADHSNKLKALANRARLESVNTSPIPRSPSAARTYAKELKSLDSKLDLAYRNKPLERQANIIAKGSIDAMKAANPGLDGDSLKKIRYRELTNARTSMSAGKQQIEINSNEWNAIQAGAVSPSKLDELLKNADLEVVRKLATPRPDRLMTNAKTAQAVKMLSLGYTRAEVASRLGVSLTTLDVATIGDGVE